MYRARLRHGGRMLAAIGAATAALIAGACGGDNGNGGDPGDPSRDQVTFLTGFGTFGREALAYVAVELGYFAEEGIDVTIEPGSGTIPNINQAVDGSADFALGDLTGAVLAYANEQTSRDFTVVGAIHQQTVFAIVALSDSGIVSPQDLEGRTIGDAQGSFGPLLWPTYAGLADINVDEVDYNASFDPPQLPSLLATETVDAIGQFLMGKPTLEAAAGQEVVVLPFSDVIRDLYGNSLITSTALAEENPDLVIRFRQALMRGLEYSVQNPQEAGQIMVDAVPEVDPGVAAAELELMAPYIQPLAADAPIGSVDEQRMEQTIAVLEGAGAIPPGLDPNDIVSFSLVAGSDE